MKKLIFSRQCDADKDIIPLWYHWYKHIYKADEIIIMPMYVKGSTTIDWVKQFYKDKNVDLYEKEFERWFAQDAYDYQKDIIKKYIAKSTGDYSVLWVDSDEFFEPIPEELCINRKYVSYTQRRMAVLEPVDVNNIKDVLIYDINEGNNHLVNPHSEPRTMYINNYDTIKYPHVQRTKNMQPSGFYFFHFHFRGLGWCKNKFKNMKYIPNAPGSSHHWKKYTKILNSNTEEEINKEYENLKSKLIVSKVGKQFKGYF